MFTFNPDMLLLSDGICCLILHRGGRYTHQWIINFSIKVVTTCSSGETCSIQKRHPQDTCTPSIKLVKYQREQATFFSNEFCDFIVIFEAPVSFSRLEGIKKIWGVQTYTSRKTRTRPTIKQRIIEDG
ncbi:hypothetical protein ABKN59_011966 [Abortiporus biennis]